MSSRKYGCKTATETREWIQAILEFLQPYRFFLDAHVVNFFTHKLWEAVDNEWLDCLRNEPIENLLQIPSGVVHDHWPASLKDFVLTIKSLSFPRQQANLPQEFPGLEIASLNNVLAQGMNRKKKHEIEALAAIVSSVAREVGSSTVVDVGAGQGYLAQVLAFQHELSVFAIDACLHHGKITDARAERIRKYYAAKLQKSGSENRELIMPKTVTCQVLSANMLKTLSNSLIRGENVKPNIIKENIGKQCQEGPDESELPSSSDTCGNSSLVLAGLHACGDLSVTMLRTFLECDKVKSVISIGCCYNLLSERGYKETSSVCGFPMSKGVKYTGFALGKSACDLACQSAERWRSLGKFAGLHNFELHSFRAAFQMVLSQYYPELLTKSPSIGRQGKALRRQKYQRILESNLNHKDPEDSCEGSWFASGCIESGNIEKNGSCWDNDAFSSVCSYQNSMKEENSPVDRFSLFLKFCHSGLGRLGVHHFQDIDFHKLWEEAQLYANWPVWILILQRCRERPESMAQLVPSIEVLAIRMRSTRANGLIGPYWSLRAALGPVLETVILLDRLLFLQEQSSVLEVAMLSIFDPILSPRNVALIAKKI